MSKESMPSGSDRPDRLDRLKGPRPTVSGIAEEWPDGNKPQREPSVSPSRPLGPQQANEEWRRLYASIRRATERLRE